MLCDVGSEHVEVTPELIVKVIEHLVYHKIFGRGFVEEIGVRVQISFKAVFARFGVAVLVKLLNEFVLIGITVDGFDISFTGADAFSHKQVDYFIDRVAFGDRDRNLLVFDILRCECGDELVVVHCGIEGLIARDIAV